MGIDSVCLRIYSHRKLTVQGAHLSSLSVLDKLNFSFLQSIITENRGILEKCVFSFLVILC